MESNKIIPSLIVLVIISMFTGYSLGKIKDESQVLIGSPPTDMQLATFVYNQCAKFKGDK